MNKQFKFNEHGVCINPIWVDYYELPGNPLFEYCRVALFQHPDTGEWMGAPSFKNGYTGHHGSPSKWSLRRFATRPEAELHYVEYMLGEQFSGKCFEGAHSYLSVRARRAAQHRLDELKPPVGAQLGLFV